MGRKTAGGLIFSRGGCSFITGDGNSGDGNVRYCSRLRCSASLCSLKNTEIGNAARGATHTRASSIVGASSQLISSACSLLKSHSDKHTQQKRTRTSTRETTDAENSTRRASMNPNHSTRIVGSNLRGKKKEDSEFIPTSSGKQMVVTDQSEPESRVLPSFSADEHGELGTCSARLNLTVAKQVTRQSSCNTPESSCISKSCFSTSENTDLAVDHTAQSVGTGMKKYTYRDSKGSAIRSSDPSGFGRRASAVQKLYSSGKGSLGRDNSTSASPRRDLSVSLPSASEIFISQQSSIRSKRQHHDMGLIHNSSNVVPSKGARMRQQEQVDTNSFLSEHQTSVRFPENELGSSSARSRGDEVGAASVSSSGYSFALPRIIQQSGSNIGLFLALWPTPLQVARASSVITDGNQNLSMLGIAQLLLALDRIEQDEQTYEQELGLGNDLHLDAQSFIDRHRDMRMDIDNMTYEELLALEEKIGTVSTTLAEEVLSSCLVRSTFKRACLDPEITNHEGEEAKCSICQEEYAVGEELGKLACSHQYHIACIHQWFRLKNWCPICKAYAAPAS